VNDTQLLGLTLSKQIEQAAQRELELLRENAALREDAITLCEIIDRADSAAWRNGNTHPDTGGPDEGEILMSNLYSPLRAKYLRAAIDAARKEAQP
jgi:hypothetical protein